ncbi:hypothetical protein L828_2109 [Mycobacteroides abscessus MAB_030201_1061]|nr:hypothetical protein L828_2109 [Mycobacteroides abscessus MAB_030201_1061]
MTPGDRNTPNPPHIRRRDYGLKKSPSLVVSSHAPRRTGDGMIELIS